MFKSKHKFSIFITHNRLLTIHIRLVVILDRRPTALGLINTRWECCTVLWMLDNSKYNELMSYHMRTPLNKNAFRYISPVISAFINTKHSYTQSTRTNFILISEKCLLKKESNNADVFNAWKKKHSITSSRPGYGFWPGSGWPYFVRGRHLAVLGFRPGLQGKKDNREGDMIIFYSPKKCTIFSVIIHWIILLKIPAKIRNWPGRDWNPKPGQAGIRSVPNIK